MAKPQRTVVKEVPYAVLYSDDTILISDCRASYPHVFVAYAGDDGGEPAFGIVGLMPKETHGQAKDLCLELMAKVMKAAKVERLPADKKFIRNGDEQDKDGYAGCFTISAREKRRPRVLGRDRLPLDPDKQSDVIYGGCIVNILIRPWVQNNKYGKRCNAGLTGVQFVRDGEAFGEGRLSNDDIDSSFGAPPAAGFSDGLGGDGGDDNGGL